MLTKRTFGTIVHRIAAGIPTPPSGSVVYDRFIAEAPKNDYDNSYLFWEEEGYWYKEELTWISIANIENTPTWSQKKSDSIAQQVSANKSLKPVHLSQNKDGSFTISDGIHRISYFKYNTKDGKPYTHVLALARIIKQKAPPAKNVQRARNLDYIYTLFSALKQALDPYLISWDKHASTNESAWIEIDVEDPETWESASVRLEIQGQMVKFNGQGFTGDARKVAQELSPHIKKFFQSNKQ